jgi:hypothetical protein
VSCAPGERNKEVGVVEEIGEKDLHAAPHDQAQQATHQVVRDVLQKLLSCASASRQSTIIFILISVDAAVDAAVGCWLLCCVHGTSFV